MPKEDFICKLTGPKILEFCSSRVTSSAWSLNGNMAAPVICKQCTLDGAQRGLLINTTILSDIRTMNLSQRILSALPVAAVD